MDQKKVAILLAVLLALVCTVSLSYFVFSQPNQIQNTPYPTPTPTPEPKATPEATSAPTPTPTPSPSEEPTQQAFITKPSVPEFTLGYVDLSYYEPPTYGIDQFTGETIITQGGYRVDNRSIQLIIKNQHFTPYTDSTGIEIGLYYNFRVKGAYGEEWRYYPFAPNGYTTRRYGGLFGGNSSESPEEFSPSNSEYTTISIPLSHLFYDVPNGAELEFQVQALVGFMEPTDYMLAGHVYFFTGESSGWSSTQTLNIP